jgi:hypothetical protein
MFGMANMAVFTVFQDTGEIQPVFTRRGLGAGRAADENLLLRY